MAIAPHTGAVLVETAQAQKEVTVNEALVRIDALLNTGAKDKDLTAPPGSPAAGDVYIVQAGATAAWAGRDGQIAYFDQIWRFIPPREGLVLWVNDEQALYRFTGSAWEMALPTKRTRCLRLHSGDLRPSVSGGCSPAANAAQGAGQPDIGSLDFDGATAESAQALLKLPRQWDKGPLTARFVWSHGAATGGFGVLWQAEAVAMGDNEPLATSFGSVAAIADSGGVAGRLYISDFSAPLTVAGTPQMDDAVFLRVSRSPSHASDTLAADARLHEVRVYFDVWEAANE